MGKLIKNLTKSRLLKLLLCSVDSMHPWMTTISLFCTNVWQPLRRMYKMSSIFTGVLLSRDCKLHDTEPHGIVLPKQSAINIFALTRVLLRLIAWMMRLGESTMWLPRTSSIHLPPLKMQPRSCKTTTRRRCQLWWMTSSCQNDAAGEGYSLSVSKHIIRSSHRYSNPVLPISLHFLWKFPTDHPFV